LFYLILFQDKDYAAFFKDRIDTIRVYRSVKGNMAGLTSHYSVRGLEPFLEYHKHIALQRQQRTLVTAVLAEQHRQKLMGGPRDPAPIQALVSRLAATARQEALDRAALDVVKTHDDSDGNSSDEDSDDDDDDVDDSDGGSHHEEDAKYSSKQASTASLASISSARPFAVNMTELRNMNLRLLHEMKPSLTTSNVVAPPVARRSSLLDDVDKEVEQWSRLLQLQRRRRASQQQLRSSSSSQQQQAATTRGMMNLPFSFTTTAPAGHRRDTFAFSHQTKMLMMHCHQSAPSLHSLQPQVPTRIRSAGNDLLDRTMHHASSPATTSVSICRRDSLSGLR